MLAWKILVDIIPSRDRIKRFIPLNDMSCFLCGGFIEYVHYVLFECSLSRFCWLNSPWNMHIHLFHNLSPVEWFLAILNKSSGIQLNLDEDGKTRVLHFVVLIFEHLWLARNKIRLGQEVPNWTTLSQQLNKAL